MFVRFQGCCTPLVMCILKSCFFFQIYAKEVSYNTDVLLAFFLNILEPEDLELAFKILWSLSLRIKEVKMSKDESIPH